MKLNLQNIRFDIPINYEFKQLGIQFFYSKERPRIVRAATEVHDSSLIYAVEDKNFETEKKQAISFHFKDQNYLSYGSRFKQVLQYKTLATTR